MARLAAGLTRARGEGAWKIDSRGEREKWRRPAGARAESGHAMG